MRVIYIYKPILNPIFRGFSGFLYPRRNPMTSPVSGFNAIETMAIAIVDLPNLKMMIFQQTVRLEGSRSHTGWWFQTF